MLAKKYNKMWARKYTFTRIKIVSGVSHWNKLSFAFYYKNIE